MKTKFVFLVFILLYPFLTVGQSKIKGEIYFLMDTASVPANDRIYEIKEINSLVGYHIKCPIYKSPDSHPAFYHPISKQPIALSKKEFSKIKFTSLKDFLTLLRSEQRGINLWKVYIVEKRSKKYYMSYVVFGGTGDPEIE